MVPPTKYEVVESYIMLLQKDEDKLTKYDKYKLKRLGLKLLIDKKFKELFNQMSML